MAQKYNLDGIKKEMETRRNERNTVSEQLGEPAITGQPKDGFLNGLITSFHTGRETHATKRIKLIENNIDIKEGKKPKFAQNNDDLIALQEVSQNRNTNRDIRVNATMSPEEASMDRDELMYSQMSHNALRGGQSLSESLVNLGGNQNKGNMPIPQSQLTEGVKNVVNNYLAENFGLIVEESIRNTILEQYAVDRIKLVLHENKSLIKGIVLEILKEMKAKQKV